MYPIQTSLVIKEWLNIKCVKSEVYSVSLKDKIEKISDIMHIPIDIIIIIVTIKND